MLYRIAAVALVVVLLSSCSEENAFSGSTLPTTTTTSDSGGGGGGSEGGTAADTTTGGGTTPTASSIVRKTQIPSAIPDGMGGTLTVSFESYDMGNSDASISYILDDANGMQRVFRPDAGGPVELYSRPSPELIFTTTSGNGNKILSHNGVRDVIDYTDGNMLAIGAALGAQKIDVISDAGDVVAFASNEDLTGANPTGVNQLFTLSTDGADTYNQITTFTINHMMEYVVLSGDGSRIFFSSTSDLLEDGSNIGGMYQVFSVNTDGTGLTKLTDLNSSRVNATHSSSDGSIITLEIVNLDGNGIKWVQTLNTETGLLSEIVATSGAGFSIDYDLSGDGSKVTYLSAGTVAGVPIVYLLNSDGSSKTDVLSERGSIRALRLNTDGSQISFQSNIEFDTPIGSDELSIQVYTLSLQ
mgnify:CR=1 FL=1